MNGKLLSDGDTPFLKYGRFFALLLQVEEVYKMPFKPLHSRHDLDEAANPGCPQAWHVNLWPSLRMQCWSDRCFSLFQGVDLYHENKKYFGLSEFIESTLSGHSLPLLRYDSSFEAMVTALGKRYLFLFSVTRSAQQLKGEVEVHLASQGIPGRETFPSWVTQFLHEMHPGFFLLLCLNPFGSVNSFVMLNPFVMLLLQKILERTVSRNMLECGMMFSNQWRVGKWEKDNKALKETALMITVCSVFISDAYHLLNVYFVLLILPWTLLSLSDLILTASLSRLLLLSILCK